MVRTTTKIVSVRDLQHNLSDYLKLVKDIPLEITKYGEKAAILVNPETYTITAKKQTGGQTAKDIMQSPFIGMHKDKKAWQGKTSVEITDELRTKAWYGS